MEFLSPEYGLTNGLVKLILWCRAFVCLNPNWPIKFRHCHFLEETSKRKIYGKELQMCLHAKKNVPKVKKLGKSICLLN